MPDKIITEIIEDMISFGVPAAQAHLLAGKLIEIGIHAAPFRPETIAEIAELLVKKASSEGKTYANWRRRVG